MLGYGKGTYCSTQSKPNKQHSLMMVDTCTLKMYVDMLLSDGKHVEISSDLPNQF